YFAPVPIPPVRPDVEAEPPQNALPNSGAAPLVDLILGPEVFTHARADLADLRLYNAAGTPIPYALRYLRPQSVREAVQTVEFNRTEPETGPHELTLDLMRDDIQHNEIQINTTG